MQSYANICSQSHDGKSRWLADGETMGFDLERGEHVAVVAISQTAKQPGNFISQTVLWVGGEKKKGEKSVCCETCLVDFKESDVRMFLDPSNSRMASLKEQHVYPWTAPLLG